ncbi:hypothetical protein ARMSODRAFT_960225 [Armillaria solidipes]|uniref:Uncharacterized protein n=1 Tax=Armillaria solidipes TaxID=1076256 RepID=A0A2H3B9C6_9AGAR|nr:hypothetical protein ARMSODRAFT_960225 [Armillaria solidipes]
MELIVRLLSSALSRSPVPAFACPRALSFLCLRSRLVPMFPAFVSSCSLSWTLRASASCLTPVYSFLPSSAYLSSSRRASLSDTMSFSISVSTYWGDFAIEYPALGIQRDWCSSQVQSTFPLAVPHEEFSTPSGGCEEGRLRFRFMPSKFPP